MQNDSSVGQDGLEKQSKWERGFRWGTLPFGKLFLPIYKSWSKGKEFWAVAFKLPNGKRARVTTTNEHAIPGLATKIAMRRATFGRSRCVLWGDDALIWKRVKEAMAPAKITLYDIVKEWVTAVQKLNGVPLLEAVEGYLKYKPKELKPITFEALAALYVAKKRPDWSKESLRNNLSKFKALVKFLRGLREPVEYVSELTPEGIRESLGQTPLPRWTRLEHEQAVTTLVRCAVRDGYLPLGSAEAFRFDSGGKKTRKEEAKIPEIFMPEEVASIIGFFWPKRWTDRSHYGMLMVTVLGAFGGIRPDGEIARLLWKHVDFEKGHIYLPAERAKDSRYREIPLEANLRAFLLVLKPKCARPNDPLVPDENAAHSLSDSVKLRGICWKGDGMRHSYATYRLERGDSVPLIVKAMGTSEEKFYANYRGRIRDVADVPVYWAIMPPAEGKRPPQRWTRDV